MIMDFRHGLSIKEHPKCPGEYLIQKNGNNYMPLGKDTMHLSLDRAIEVAKRIETEIDKHPPMEIK